MGETLDTTPVRHLEMLLARAQNPFDVSDSVLGRLDDAVLCRVEARGRRHRNTPPPALRCSSYRHAFLLADGSSLSLWELRYESGDGGTDGEPLSEIYECEEALRVSQRRAHRGPSGVTPDGAPGGVPPEPPDDPGWDAVPPDPGHLDLLTGGGRLRPYAHGDSPDHARRLLRRAENPDRPGEETLRLLSTARGHDIAQVPRSHTCTPAHHVWCSVYEHAFLLADGREISLYELEHNLTGSGQLVCEVYLEEAVAELAARRRARDRGIEL